MIQIARFFIDNFKFTIVLSFGVMIFGALGLLNLNSESYPPVAFSVATITTRYEGASAKDIELKITKPIEDELRKVTGVRDVRSVSQAGVSKITVRVDDEHADLNQAMTDLERAVDRTRGLPQDLKDPPEFLEIKSEEIPVVEIAITGRNENRERDIVADMMKEDLEDIKEILSVRLVGFHERLFAIELDLEKMERMYISVDEVIGKLSLRNVNIPGGKIKKSKDQKLVRIDGKISDTVDIENIVLRGNYNGQLIRVKDVAKVIDGKNEVPFLAQFNGEPATLLIATKKAGADTLALVDKISKKIDDFKKEHGEFEYHIYNDESIKVRNKLNILASNAYWGLGLVLFFLLLFLPGRVGITASMSLPLSVAATFGFLPIFGVNLNAITILALVIALGMLVDNSVVISENYTRLREDGETPIDAIMTSIKQLWIPITATVATTIASFMPMLVTKGIMGKFIMYIPIIVSTSLLISLFESFFLLPMRLKLSDKHKDMKKDSNKVEKKKIKVFEPIANLFEKLILWTVKLRYLSFIVYILLMVGSGIAMFKYNRADLFPPKQVEMYLGRIETPNGFTQDNTSEIVKLVTQKVGEKLGDKIKFMVARTGTSQMGPFDPKAQSSDNVGMISIYVTDETKNQEMHQQILDELRSIILPEGTLASFQMQQNGPPVGEAVHAIIRSNSQTQLDAAVTKMSEQLGKVKGVVDVTTDDVVENKEITISIDYKKASMLGLDVKAIGDAIRTGISGRTVSNVNIEGKNVDLKVQLEKGQRISDKALSQIQVLDHRGNLISVASVAKTIVQEGSHQIKRYDYKRSKTITASIKEGQTTAIIANSEFQKIFDGVSKEYPGMSLVFGGEQESTNESLQSLGEAYLLSLIGIFALLVLMFNSFWMPIVIMSTIFLGFVGFSVAFAIQKEPISFLAMIGVIGLGGIIVNSGIILISFIEELRKEENGLGLTEVLARASKLRLRAVLVSSLTTISGLVPTAYGWGGSDALLQPLTLAMAWGLTSGTILTLIWIPAAYAIVEDISNLGKRIFSRG